jgi:hypothetical protein
MSVRAVVPVGPVDDVEVRLVDAVGSGADYLRHILDGRVGADLTCTIAV